MNFLKILPIEVTSVRESSMHRRRVQEYELIRALLIHFRTTEGFALEDMFGIPALPLTEWIVRNISAI